MSATDRRSDNALALRMRRMRQDLYDPVLNQNIRLVKLNPTWETEAGSAAAYADILRPYVAGQKILDVGCAGGRLWSALPILGLGHKLLVGLDVLMHNSWSSIELTTVPSLRFVHGTVTSLPEGFEPEVVLLKNVCEWLTFSEIRRLLYTLPLSVKTILLTQWQPRVTSAANLSTYIHDLPFRRFMVNSPAMPLMFSAHTCWTDNNSLSHQTFAVTNYDRIRKHIFADITDEPCPRCDTNKPPVAVDGVAFCPMCTFSSPCKTNPESDDTEEQQIRRAWNFAVRLEYTNN